MKMRRLEYEFVLVANTPIAHMQDTFGNIGMIARQRVRQKNNGFQLVPFISGSAMRHGIREAASIAALEAAGILSEEMSPTVLTDSALRLLFAGGMISGATGSIKLSEYRELVDLLPHLVLLGGCAGNRIIPGRIIVEDAVLICSETTSDAACPLPNLVFPKKEPQSDGPMPPPIVAWEDGGTASCRACVEENQSIRSDPTTNPTLAKLMSESTRRKVEARLSDNESAETSEEAKDSKSSMMPYSHERIARGSEFYWRVVATIYSKLEEDSLEFALQRFLSNAWVGGHRGTGHGNIIVKRDSNWIGEQQVGGMFRAHLQDRSRRTALCEFLANVKA